MTTEQIDNSKYIEFLKSKMAISAESGFTVSDEELTPTVSTR